MPGLMHQTAILLVTLDDEEIFAATVPNRVQAHMATDKCIIASLRPGRRHKSCCPGAALAKTILWLHTLPAVEREQMDSRGRTYYRAHFDHDTLASDLIRHLQTLPRKQ